LTPTRIVVAFGAPDPYVPGIMSALGERPEFELVGGAAVELAQLDALLAQPSTRAVVVVLIGASADLDRHAARLMDRTPAFVIVRIGVPGHVLRVDARVDAAKLGLEQLFAALWNLAAEHEHAPADRVLRLELHVGESETARSGAGPRAVRPVLECAHRWLHAVLAAALSAGAPRLEQLAVAVPAKSAGERLTREPPGTHPDPPDDVGAARRALLEAAAADPAEPLVVLRRALGLADDEWLAAILALAPELDVRYQLAFGALQDDLGRRAPSAPLLAALLGEPVETRLGWAASGALVRWRLFETVSRARPEVIPNGDEGIRLDPCVVAWLLGAADALADDPSIERVQSPSWPGAELLRSAPNLQTVARLAHALGATAAEARGAGWLVLSGDDLSSWRALLELAADRHQLQLLRLSISKYAALDPTEANDAAVRIARLLALTGAACVIDGPLADAPAAEDAALRRLTDVLDDLGRRGAIVTAEPDRCVDLLAAHSLRFERPAPDSQDRLAMLGVAARSLHPSLSERELAPTANAFPLDVEGMARAERIARASLRRSDSAERVLSKLHAACRRAAAHRVTRLAQRITPKYALKQLVLPADRHRQLLEIVAHVQHAATVLDRWRFGEQLPYGRGVTALFAGPSGTGKTMAAQGIARELGIEVFALDLSRVVSKYIGETEKHIDAVFGDAQRSGALVLIDEADALLGKRSEVKDAHDRYANIEVAYLLQRMESFGGLAVMTTNLRQNIDAAFLRRLRFVVDFPQPDAAARAAIWRGCVPDDTPVADDIDWRLLGSFELSGGAIRQVTLRAAFRAAALGAEHIGMSHLLEALRGELGKLGLQSAERELDQHLRDRARERQDEAA